MPRGRPGRHRGPCAGRTTHRAARTAAVCPAPLPATAPTWGGEATRTPRAEHPQGRAYPRSRPGNRPASRQPAPAGAGGHPRHRVIMGWARGRNALPVHPRTPRTGPTLVPPDRLPGSRTSRNEPTSRAARSGTGGAGGRRGPSPGSTPPPPAPRTPAPPPGGDREPVIHGSPPAPGASRGPGWHSEKGRSRRRRGVSAGSHPPAPRRRREAVGVPVQGVTENDDPDNIPRECCPHHRPAPHPSRRAPRGRRPGPSRRDDEC